MIGFAGFPLDRADHLRGDETAVVALAARPDARALALADLDPVTVDGRLGWEPVGYGEHALLGLANGAPLFVRLGGGDARRRSEGLLAAVAALPPGEAALYAAARSLVDWHARHGFCANCGHATRPIRAGWARACTACGAEHFPRTDPVVIMLAEHRGRVLLGRQVAFPPGRYSALAGFVEVGEGVEEAVARELREEAGIAVGAIRYVASQPWPFPSQLMIGCIADALDDQLTIDRTELEDAFWATREEVLAALADAPGVRFGVPPPIAIAHSLLSRWADG